MLLHVAPGLEGFEKASYASQYSDVSCPLCQASECRASGPWEGFFLLLFMHLFMAPVSTVKSPYYHMGYIRYSLYYDRHPLIGAFLV